MAGLEPGSRAEIERNELRGLTERVEEMRRLLAVFSR
jgi:hypothetical protein